MKRKIALIVSLMAFTAFAYVDRNPADVHVKIKNKEHNHNEWNIPADMPDVYYDYVSGTITIVDYVNATYYVNIIDDWNTVVLTDIKVGGGTIDVSSLSTGDYVIDITTSWNNQYEGEFTVP